MKKKVGWKSHQNFKQIISLLRYSIGSMLIHQIIHKSIFWSQNVKLNWAKLAWCKDRRNMYTMYAVQLICANLLLVLSVYCSYKWMYLWYIWQTYYTGITKKKLIDVEIQEQTAFFIILLKDFLINVRPFSIWPKFWRPSMSALDCWLQTVCCVSLLNHR